MSSATASLGGDPGGDSPADLAAKFFAAAVNVIETPWMQAAIPDFARPETTGERPADLEQRLKFGGAPQRLAAQDPEVHRLMVEVRHPHVCGRPRQPDRLL
jgi:hypothetical protein